MPLISSFLSILTVDFPSLLRSSVNLTFGRKRCSESVVASLPHLLLPCFYCPAHQVPWEDRKPYNKKRHTLRCAFKQSAASYHTRPWQYSIHSFFMYGTLFWASSKVMCGPHASLRSSVASHPTLPTPSHRLLSIDNTCTTLAGDGSSRN